MTIAGIGIDIVSIDRFERLLERHGERFIERVCRPGEVRQKEAVLRPQHVGGLFAAKEAVLKALGTGWDRGLGFRQIEVRRASGGRPTIQLHDRAAELAADLGVSRIHVSITHDHGVSAAVAVLERELGEGESR